MRILVVEKYFDVAETFKEILESSGFEVDFAFCSSDVELKIEFADIVVCDSYEIYQHPDFIVKICKFREIPCILTTCEPITVSEPVPILMKPFASEVLVQEVSKAAASLSPTN